MPGKLKKLSADQASEAVILYGEGSSLAVISSRYGVSRQAMWDLLRRRTTLRSQTRSGTDNHFYRGGSRSFDRVHNEVETAIGNGTLKRPEACEQCGASGTFKDGRSAIQAHHDDYNKPLEVRWLCQRCHYKWHNEHTAIEICKSPKSS